MSKLQIKYMNKAELIKLRELLIKRIASAADRISLIDSRLAVIRSNELEVDLLQAEEAKT